MLTARYVPNPEERCTSFTMTLPTKILRELDSMRQDKDMSRSFYVRKLIESDLQKQKGRSLREVPATTASQAGLQHPPPKGG